MLLYRTPAGQVFPPDAEWQRGQPTPLQHVTAGVSAKVVELLLNFMRNDQEAQVRALLFFFFFCCLLFLFFVLRFFMKEYLLLLLGYIVIRTKYCW